MSHLKRQEGPKNWPSERKGTAYLVRPNYNLENGLPVLIAIRDMLKLAKDRREVKQAISSKQILLNHRLVLEDKDTIQLFDVLTILPAKGESHSEKNYRMVITRNKKFNLAEISKAEANHKIAKIINKKILKGNKTQINLSDGRNFISNLKCMVNDSILVNLKDKKPERCIQMKQGERAIIWAGKHAGEEGVISEIDRENNRIKLESEGKTIDILIKQIMMVE